MRYWVVCLVLLGISSCKRIDKLTQFEMDYDSSVTISSSTVVDLPVNLITPDITTNSESVFEVNNTRKDLVEKLILTQLKLKVSSPSTGNFDFLKSIHIYINSPGLPETEIAQKIDIQDGVGPILSLNTSVQDIKEYIKADQFSLRLETVTDQVLTTDYNIDISAKFFVDAKVLGQ